MSHQSTKARDPLLDFDEKRKIDPRHTHICANCWATCRPKKITQGSLAWEIVLWLLFIFPGLFYSLWRLTSRYWGCPYCEAKDPVPLRSPRGQRLLADYQKLS